MKLRSLLKQNKNLQYKYICFLQNYIFNHFFQYTIFIIVIKVRFKALS